MIDRDQPTPADGLRRDPLVIVAHEPRWSVGFAAQVGPVTAALQPWLRRAVEHIGSTAVPELAAKPIIDMLAVVSDHDQARAGFPALARAGWVAAPEPGDREAARWSWCFPTTEFRTHHLHIVEERSTGWPDWILFRDFLRTHPQARAEYAQIKARLVQEDPDDRLRYRAGKAPTIHKLLAQARRWRPSADHLNT